MYNPTLNFICYKHSRTKGVPIQLHSHSCYELVYFHKAKGTLNIGNSVYPIYPNMIYLVYPQTPHSEIHLADGCVSFLGFECPNFPRKSIKEITFDILEHENIRALMGVISKEATEQKKNHSEIISNILSEIMLLLERYALCNVHTEKSLDYVASYIHEYYNQQINFTQLAKHYGYSADHFRNLFIQRIGIAPKQYQINIRLEKSAEMLANSQLSCTEIASLCGFSTSSQFTKMFSQKYGTTPIQYKKSLI